MWPTTMKQELSPKVLYEDIGSFSQWLKYLQQLHFIKSKKYEPYLYL